MDDYITCKDTSTKAESTKLLIRAVLEQLGLPGENAPIRCTDLAGEHSCHAPFANQLWCVVIRDLHDRLCVPLMSNSQISSPLR